MGLELQPTPKMKMLPAEPGTCVHCATAHAEYEPHNYWSIYYQMRFKAKWNRAATHADCVAHLPKSSRSLYRRALEEYGYDWSEPVDGEPLREPYAESEG